MHCIIHSKHELIAAVRDVLYSPQYSRKLLKFIKSQLMWYKMPSTYSAAIYLGKKVKDEEVGGVVSPVA